MAAFDLESALASWRQRMKSRGAFLPEDLDELEGHIRDHVDSLVAEGRSRREAFFIATERLGTNEVVKDEYRKVRYGKSKRRDSATFEIAQQLALLRNYARTATRNLARHKGFSAINLIGLAAGLAGCLLVSIFVRDELSYDRFNEKADRIYRLGATTVGWPYGHIVADEYPEVERVVYMRSYPRYSIRYDNNLYFESMLYADSSFFDVFDYDFREGDANTALTAPYSVVLSANFAKRLFGEGAAVGRTLSMADSIDFNVTAVVDVPRNSQIQFEALLSFSTMRAIDPAWFDSQMESGWLNVNVVNYLLLRDGVDAEAFAQKIYDLPQQRAGEYLGNWGSDYKLNLEPLLEIYLNSRFGNTLGPTSSIDYIYLLSAVGLFLLLIAALNFVNLSTARSAERAKEVGVRKVVGSDRSTLVRQFVGESMLLCLVAVVLAFGIALAALPFFRQLTVRHYGYGELLSLPAITTLLVLAIVVGLLAGLYPAFTLSAFRPVEVLKGRFASGKRGGRLRKGLVVFQFAVSGVLVVATLVVINQVHFMQSRDLGFDGDRVLVLDARRAPWKAYSEREETFKQSLAANPSVAEVSGMYAVPGRTGWRGQLSFPEGWPPDESIGLEYIGVDFDFASTLGLAFVAGRSFDRTIGPDATEAVVINEAAVRAVGWESPQAAIGKQFASPGSGKPNGVVIGVVADYHQHGLQERIEPIMFGIRSGNGLVMMRLKSADAPGVLPYVDRTWRQFFDGYPFETFFLNEDFDRQYDQEQRLQRVFMTFALLTILIGCLGLFALAAFTSMQRTKEIGVRKTLGATTPNIVSLLVSDFLKWVLAAFAVSAPISWLLMSRWLEGFAYHTTIRPSLFLFGGLALVAVALLTVGYTAIRAAVAHPARSLRYE